jgi:hypothetical protein
VLVAHDVGAVRIVEPGRQVDSGTVVAPKALVRNYGTSDETFDVIFSIGRVYADTQAVRLLVGATDTVTFADWVAQPVGWHGARVQTTLVGDENPANDVATDSFQVIPTTGIEGGTSLPRRFSISRLGANPSVSTGGVRYELPRSVDVRVTVYSADGRQVKTLLAGAQRPGYYALPWNGTNDAGRTVGTGIYYVQMQAGEFSGTVKLVKSN